LGKNKITITLQQAVPHTRSCCQFVASGDWQMQNHNDIGICSAATVVKFSQQEP
jgi:hypothetical protein